MQDRVEQGTRVWVSIGSNIDRERNIRTAVAALRAGFGALRLSRVYECPAVGFSGEAFYNLVAGFDTELSPAELSARLRAIENAQGRVRSGGKFSSRTLDIDLLSYGDQVLDRGEVHLPRDEILKYAFVLGPLAEVAPQERHPVDGRSYRELWDAFDKTGQPVTPVDLDLEVGLPG